MRAAEHPVTLDGNAATCGLAARLVRFARQVTLCGLLALVAGCGIADRLRDRSERADAIAASGGLQRLHFEARGFRLRAYGRALSAATPLLVVYIEGDGAAWRSANRPPVDPTPVDPIALRLAAVEPAEAVLYLGRPCQYERDGACEPRYWASARFAPRVVEAFGDILDTVQARAGDRQLALVGWSGGGALAALLSARRSDVAWLLTVAAPLDVARWAALNGLTPLHESLDPANQRTRIAAVRQLHLAGADDQIVPPAIVRAFVEGLGAGAPAGLRVLDEFGHQCCWVEQWRELRGSWPPPDFDADASRADVDRRVD